MKNWLKKRAKEPSTWAGLAALAGAVGTIVKDDHVPQIAQQVGQHADAMAAGDWTTPLAIILSGLMAVLMGEKGGDDGKK